MCIGVDFGWGVGYSSILDIDKMSIINKMGKAYVIITLKTLVFIGFSCSLPDYVDY